MKPTQTWQFSCRAADIDVARILRECGKIKEVVRLTVGPKTFTIAPRYLAARACVEHLALGTLTISTKFSNEYGGLRVEGLGPAHTSIWSPNRQQERLIFDQDLACKLVRCVVTKVETF